MNDASIPVRYRRLLWTSSPLWRRAYGDVTLATLLEVHQHEGRSKPSPQEWLSFTLVGLLTRLPGGVVARRSGSPGSVAARLAVGSDSAPPAVSPLHGGFFLMRGLGATGTTARFPDSTASLSLPDLVRRRRSAALRLVAATIALGIAAALLLGTPVVGLPVLGAGVLLVSMTALVFDVTLFRRLGRQILLVP